MRNLIIPFLLLSTLISCSEKQDHYSNIAEAKEKKLFERGWLPDILPDSTRNIITNNHLDNAVSYGEFHFNRADFLKFLERFNKATSNVDHQEDKWITLNYKDANGNWEFYCNHDKEICQYKMSKESGRN
ncbi:MAG: hypothetical protein J0M25_13030 [Flavobacteriales bacterium]|nr:hypothetical protein [Flavobacteriales bacterium]